MISVFHFQLKNYYLKLLASFLFIVLFSITIYGIIFDFNTIKFLQQEINRSNINTLNQTKDAIDALMGQVDLSEIQLSLDPYISKYLTPWPEFDLVELGKIQTVISNAKSSNESIHSIYLYYPISSFIITSFGQYDMRTFTDVKWLTEAQNIDDRKFWLKTREIVDFERKFPVKVITYIRKLPFHKKSSYGYIVTNIYEKSLSKKIQNLDLGSTGYTFIINDSGELITHSSNEVDDKKMMEFYEIKSLIAKGGSNSIQKLKGKEIMLSVVTSRFNMWKYVTVHPVAEWVSKTHIITKINIIAVFTALIIAIVLSYFLSRHMYFPIRKLLNWTRKPDDSVIFKYKEFEIINKKMNEIIAYNQNLSTRLWQAMPALKEKFLYDIISGNVKDEKKNNGNV